jgi:transcriptional regulator with XRE-family HTH domain
VREDRRGVPAGGDAMTRLGRAIRYLRVTEELTGVEAARRIGVHPSTLSRLERGRAVEASAVARIFSWLTAEEMVVDEDEPQSMDDHCSLLSSYGGTE